jgi:iron complex transport system substrate-binding protein
VKTAFVAPLLLAFGALSFSVALFRGVTRPGALSATRYGASVIRGDTFPKTLHNGDHTSVIPRAAVRVASLTVTADEILTELLSPERIAAVTPFADDPLIEAGAGRAPRGAARIRGVDPEGVISLEPDLVFVAHYTLEAGVSILQAAGIPVIKFRETRSYDDVAANVRLAASAVGERERGEALVRTMQTRLATLASVVSRGARPRVLYYSPVGYTTGTGTLVDEKIRLAGGRNAAADAGLVGFRDVTVDILVELDPDVIVVPRWSKNGAAPVRDVTESPAFKDVSAVVKGRVYALPASSLTSESPDGVVGVEDLARLLHPEAFPS